jgi:RecB family exonuclease
MARRPAASARVPQRRRLVRTADLAAFRATLIDLAREGRAADIRRRALILPTRGAIDQLRRGIEDAALRDPGTAVLLPMMLTREDWLHELHASHPSAPPWLPRVDREVLFERAARLVEAHTPPPFKIRPGLIGAMLDFYDELRRRGRTTERFASAMQDELAGYRDNDDRGTAGLAAQTDFLAGVFTEYEASLGDRWCDEHVLRRLVLESDTQGISHLIVAVADHPSDPRGLWPADFDLVGRLRSLEAVDIVVTDETHDAGFRDRLDREVPQLDEIRVERASTLPTLMSPAGSLESTPETKPGTRPATREDVCVEYRDREEELRGVARDVRARSAARATRLDRTAVVFQRPLPYLYLAQQVLADAGIPYQTFDAMPLSAEPYAALLDLALSAAQGGLREHVIALGKSPLVALSIDGEPVSSGDMTVLDRVLIERRVTAEPPAYAAAVDAFFLAAHRPAPEQKASALRAAAACVVLWNALAGFREADRASGQIDALAAALRRFERPPLGSPERVPLGNLDRELRARRAVLATLDGLAAAFRLHDDTPRAPDVLSATIHHWIERQTFSPRRGSRGVQLVDAVAARFGEFDHVHLVGLVDAEWPERQRRSVFYTSGLLETLGWPGGTDHLKAQQAAFRDLMRLPLVTLSLSAFQLEGDAVVTTTPMTDEARVLPRSPRTARDMRTFSDERLALAPIASDGLADVTAAWLALRQVRPSLVEAAYRGEVGAQAPREYRVSSLDRFVECPFKFFAGTVLRLDEEVEEDSGLSPRERGTLLHAMFERFYREWDAAGRGTITPLTLHDAVKSFEQIAHAMLAPLPESERVLEATRLLGSIVMRGAAERVFQVEIDDGREVSKRLLEEPLHGTYEFPQGFAPPRPIAIRGVADRIDMLADGTIRVIDYKLSRAPRGAPVQLKVYGFAAQQRLEKTGAGHHDVSSAFYVSFANDGAPLTPVALKGVPAQQAIEAGAQDFAGHVARIEAGQFPPRPEHAGLCEWCAFALVCRKETVDGEEEDAAEPV